MTTTGAAKLQDGLLKLLGNTPESRTPLIASMLSRSASESTAYWLQLVVAVGMATLGLVVGSAAVVIGAMLVAPLMGPIVGLAMGLAAGSPFLVLRSALRVALSVGVAVAGAALITRLLPFHELNSEIAARTTPTVLDLVTAAFCALIGVYATLRSGSDTATTAAGTSIGISLVPPLCASGYGIGTAAWSVAWGAGLLFLTNMVAIVVVGTIAFLSVGFNRVGIAALEHDELSKDATKTWFAHSLTRWLASVFESRVGPVLRFLMPFVLLGAVFVPLKRALNEVAWQVRVKSAVRDIIAQQSLPVVQSRVRIERREVDVVVVFLGKTEDGNEARQQMDTAIRQASGVNPRIEVLTVPDANAVAGLESTLLAARPVAVVAAPPPPPISPNEEMMKVRQYTRESVKALWPVRVLGEPIEIELETAVEEYLQLRVVHVGPQADPATIETLQQALSELFELEVLVRSEGIKLTPIVRGKDDLGFVADVSAALSSTAAYEAINVCVVRPEPLPAARRAPPGETALAETMERILATHPRVTTTVGGPWSVKLSAEACVGQPASQTNNLSVPGP